MANQILIPILNPVQFYEYELDSLPQYESRHMDDYLFSEQVRADQLPVRYYQKWTVNDAIKLQFESNFDPIVVQLVDCELNVILTQNAVQRRKNKYLPGFYIYENTTSLTSVEPGKYYLLLTLGGTKKMISEPFEVFESLPYSLLLEYFNSTFHGDMVFETGLVPSFRLEAFLRADPPGNERTAYRDQQLNPTVLKSRPFRTWDLVLGGGMDYGVPPWVAHKINWIFSCDNVSIDGKPYAVFEGGIEAIDSDPGYPMKPYTLKVQEGINRSSKIVGVEVDPTKRLLVSAVVDSTVFGDTSEQAGSNLIVIQSVE